MKLFEVAKHDLISVAAAALNKSKQDAYMSGANDTRPDSRAYKNAMLKILSVSTGKSTAQVEKDLNTVLQQMSK